MHSNRWHFLACNCIPTFIYNDISQFDRLVCDDRFWRLRFDNKPATLKDSWREIIKTSRCCKFSRYFLARRLKTSMPQSKGDWTLRPVTSIHVRFSSHFLHYITLSLLWNLKVHWNLRPFTISNIILFLYALQITLQINTNCKQ